MSSSSPLGPTPVDHHLGDRLAALVDGELGHDARERVLAHLATCAKCKAEADAQRSLKNVFAQAAPPPPSEGLLARLQGLPGGPGDPGGSGGGGIPFDPVDGVDVFGVRRMPPGTGFATAAAVYPHSPKLSAPLEQGGPPGFRIHEVGRPGQDRAGRGRRFAFAAASAVSFAAIALGGTLPLEAAVEAGARGEGAGAVTPARSGGAGGAQGVTSADRGARSAERSAPLLVKAARLNADPLNADRLNAARLNDARLNAASSVQFQSPVTPLLVMSPPLIRPTGSAIQSPYSPVLPTATPEPTRLTAPTPSSDPLPSRR